MRWRRGCGRSRREPRPLGPQRQHRRHRAAGEEEEAEAEHRRIDHGHGGYLPVGHSMTCFSHPLAEPGLSRPFSRGSASAPQPRAMLRRSLLALLLLPLAARADDDDQDRARAAVERGEIRPLSRILAELERRFVGQVVDTVLDRDDGRWVYEFKLLPPSGRMYRVKMDAATGAVIETRGPVQERR